jgi:hypothetical protein
LSFGDEMEGNMGIECNEDMASAMRIWKIRLTHPPTHHSNDLPRRLFVTTTFLTIPLALGSNFLGVTSNLILSSPFPAIRSLSDSLGLNTLYPDASGYKTYTSPKPESSLVSTGRRARYKLTLPPRFVQDPAIALARAQATDPNREMRMRGGLNTIPDVAFGPMGKIDPVTRKSSSDVNISGENLGREEESTNNYLTSPPRSPPPPPSDNICGRQELQHGEDIRREGTHRGSSGSH